MLEMFGANELLDTKDFTKLLLRLGVDIFFTAIVVRVVYYRLHNRRDFVSTYILFNVVTFSLCFLLRKVPIELGFALGMFAVFGILRYRTEPIRMRDLTYLFVVIGLAILNAVANKKISIAELLLINSVIVFLTWFLEWAPISGREDTRVIVYDNLTLLEPGNNAELIEDLRARTGLEVNRVVVGDVDLLKDVARITVFCSRSTEVET